MFWGSFDHVLDEKGRTSLPKEFRETLSRLKGDPWITAGRYCLTILPSAEFQDLHARLTEDGRDDDHPIESLLRLRIGKAKRCSFDRQGRILIPPDLRKWAYLDREIVFAGLGKFVEIWDRERHQVDLENTRASYPEYTRQLRRLGS